MGESEQELGHVDVDHGQVDMDQGAAEMGQGQAELQGDGVGEERGEGNESGDSGIEESMLGAVAVDFSDDSSGGSFMHDSDWSTDAEEEEEEKEERTRKMLHLIPDYNECSDKYLDYKGPDERLEKLPQEIKEAGAQVQF